MNCANYSRILREIQVFNVFRAGVENLGWLNSLSLGGVRTNIRQPSNAVARKDPDGVKYTGFTYFPRPGEVDPPYTPSKLLMVKRIRTIKRQPHWDRRAIFELGLTDKREVAIVKNTPETCRLLYKVKHLIEITPITFPNGFPKDTSNGFLKENGEFVSYEQIGVSKPIQLDEDKKIFDSYRVKNMDAETLKRRLHLKWHSRWDIV